MTSGQALEFILGNVDPEESTPMTDENNLYCRVGKYIDHESVSHKEMYVDSASIPMRLLRAVLLSFNVQLANMLQMVLLDPV